ncbi:defensin-like [Ornithodoros turicata]|uniref:defensin-like n=1 Tax=Ornithodoros turicata TaxID=34597 RepID=UPI003138B232
MKTVFVIALVFALAVASMAQDVDDLEESSAVRVRRGWWLGGCPFNQYQCCSYCTSRGYRGGYCKSVLEHTCKCY